MDELFFVAGVQFGGDMNKLSVGIADFCTEKCILAIERVNEEKMRK